MSIALDSHHPQRRSEGGTQLDRYSSSIIPPSERRRDIRCAPVYKHLTPNGVKNLRTSPCRPTSLREAGLTLRLRF